MRAKFLANLFFSRTNVTYNINFSRANNCKRNTSASVNSTVCQRGTKSRGSSGRWANATTFTVNWSICSPSTSAQDTRIRPSSSGWWINIGILAARTWAITIYSTFSPSPRTKPRREFDSILWRRCCNLADRRLRSRRIKFSAFPFSSFPFANVSFSKW